MTDADRTLLTRYANLAGGWVGLAGDGVEQAGRAHDLRLHSVPDAGVAVGPEVTPPAGPAPAGAALDPCGNGFVSVPDDGRVLRVTRCVPPKVPAGEVTGGRNIDVELLAGTFTAPRGLLLGPRGRLYVADTDAVIVVDPRTGTVTGRWGDVAAGWCVAFAQDGVLLLDRGAPAGQGRVRRFSPDGVEDPAFGAAAAAALGGADPVRMTVCGKLLLVVVTRRSAGDAVVPLHLDGTAEKAGHTAWAPPRRTERDAVTGASVTTTVTGIDGIAADGRRVYLVDHADGDLLTFTPGGDYIGSTRPARAIADLWFAGDQVLWAYPAEPGEMSCHHVTGAWRRSGTFVCGPLNTGTVHDLRELRARFDRTAGGHLQLWTAVTPGDVPPGPQTVPIIGTAAGPWSPLPADVDVSLVADPVGPRLWIGGQLSGDGTATPVLHQIGVGGARSWMELLPAIYRKDQAAATFLDRYLRLLRSVEDETTQERLDLVRRFDPYTAEDAQSGAAGDTVLDDLSDWMAAPLSEAWPEALRRAVVAGAFAAQEIRGTPLGLLAAIAQRFPRLRVQITEPAQRAHLWSLPGGAGPTADGCATGLGFDTMLAPAPAGGAVVGVNAVVEQSTLTGDADTGGPLFADLAHRFHVAVVPDPGREASTLTADLGALLDAEKPAHTVYTLCVAGPRARVGAQARLGIDAILAGPPAALDLDTDPRLGAAALGTAPGRADEPAPTLVGQLRVGLGRLT